MLGVNPMGLGVCELADGATHKGGPGGNDFRAAMTGAGAEDAMKGVASLAWPGVALVAVVLFKTELRGALI